MTLSNLKREASKHGATVVNESGGRYSRYQCEAPTGSVWAASRTHDLVVEWRGGEPTSNEWRDNEIKDAVERMRDGIEPCDDLECDRCRQAE